MSVSAEIFEQIVRNNRMAVVYTDVAGLVKYTNEANDNLFGFAPGELNGRGFQLLNADPKYTAEKIIESANNTGGWTGEVLMRKKDKSLFFAQLNVWKIFDAEGKGIGFGSNTTDLSAQKKAEKELLEEKARLAAIINSTNDDVLSIDRNFCLVEFNEALAQKVKLGYGFDLKPGISVFTFLPPGSGEKLKAIYLRVLNGEKIMLVDEFVSTKGQKMYHETSYQPIRSREQITGIAIFSRNTTERKKREKLLEASLKERELLLAEVHHRVKNNLAIVSGFLQLEEYNTVSAEVKELLKDSKARIKTTALVHELLYKNESLNQIDLIAYIKDLLRLISDSYSTPGIKIDVVTDFIEKKIGVTRAIAVGLILNELVSNAYKHAFDGKTKGEILIALRGDEENCVLIVADNGKGLPGNFNFDESTQTGTVLVKTFVEQLNGKIEVKNTALEKEGGRGTKFIMTFGLEKDSDS